MTKSKIDDNGKKIAKIYIAMVDELNRLKSNRTYIILQIILLIAVIALQTINKTFLNTTMSKVLVMFQLISIVIYLSSSIIGYINRLEVIIILICSMLNDEYGLKEVLIELNKYENKKEDEEENK